MVRHEKGSTIEMKQSKRREEGRWREMVRHEKGSR